MAEVILTDIYRLSQGARTFGSPRLEGIPTGSLHIAAVPVQNQPATNNYVYSKLTYIAGNMVEQAYSFETVAALVTKANA